tara:strand:+ start:2229 stop:4313 length:2085 start_codon:yes stop_codon:yes gene_type:complete
MTKSSEVLDFSQPFKVAQIRVVPEHHFIELENIKVKLEPLAMATLLYLAKNQGQVVTRDKLFETLWPGKVVSQGALTRIIRILRIALNDNTSAPEYIKTIPKQGYCLLANVSRLVVESDQERLKPRTLTTITAVILMFVFVVFFNTVEPETSFTKVSFGQINGLTSLAGMEGLPQMSSDGQSILFAYRARQAQTDVLVIQKKGESTFTTLRNSNAQYKDLAWSSDQSFIAYTAYQNGECHIEVAPYSSATNVLSPARQVARCSAFFQSDIEFSLDSKFLYILVSAETGGYYIEKFDLVSYSKSRLIDRSNTELYANQLSVTGNLDTLAFVESELNSSNVHISLLSVNTHEITVLAELQSPPKEFAWLNHNNAFIVWQNQGYQLLDMAGHWEAIEETRAVHLNNLVPAANGEILFSKKLTSNFIEEHTNPMFSKEKQINRIAESSLTEGAAAYSNHTNQLAILSDRRRQGSELWLVQEEPIPIHINDIDIQFGPITWSADDKYIMVLTKQQRLAVINPQTKQYKWLTHNEDTVLAGSWGIMNDEVYFSKLIDNQFQLFATSLNESSEKQLTFDGGYFSQITHDGKTLYYNKRNQAGLWKIDLKTNQHALVSQTFGAQNYSRWKLFDNGIYYRHHNELGEGVIFFNFENQTHTVLFDDINIWMFDVSPDQQKLMLTKVDSQSDIMSLNLLGAMPPK